MIMLGLLMRSSGKVPSRTTVLRNHLIATVLFSKPILIDDGDNI